MIETDMVLPARYAPIGADRPCWTRTQRRTLWVLVGIGLIYFCAFLYPNSFGARSDAILLEASSDEYVTYPNVVRILTPGKTFNETRANLFLYEDYHYGYPFYALSALAVLPSRLLYGVDFTQHMQLNLLLLRQLISLLPMILAAGLLVYLQTRFRSLLRAVLLFVLLLSLRGVVRNNIWWWHPDALTVLCVVLTLFFLDRDQLRFGRNFYLAAVFCGLATAIKLLGVFFFLTIPFYLLVGVLHKRLTWPRAALAGVGFVAVMAAVVVFSNPFLFSHDQRARMVQIQEEKSAELRQGYTHDDPMYYSKGPQWWASTLEKWYAAPLLLAFFSASLAAACLWSQHTLLNRLILTWVVPYSVYLLYFVAVKPDHYWLPVLLPLFSAALTLLDWLTQGGGWLRAPLHSRALLGRRLGLVAMGLVLSFQLLTNLARPISGNLAVYQSAVETGKAQIEQMR